MKKRILALLLIGVMMTAVMLSGCSSKESTGDSSSEASNGNAPEQVVNTLFVADPVSFDSAKINESAANTVVLETQEGLVRLGENMKLMPAGATSWETSADGTVWTFHLRDYNWSDGTKVTASDYVYAIKRMFDPATACPNAPIFYCIDGGEAFNTGDGTADGIGAKALDESTLEITLNKPIPYFVQLTNFISLLPQKEEVVTKAGETYGSEPSEMLFSGPFKVDQWVKGSQIVLVKNENYWDADSVKLDKVVINIVPEKATAEQMFDSNALDMILDVKSEYADKMASVVKDGKITELKGYYPRCGYIAFNNEDPNNFFTNKKIRLAFSLAIDREGYTKNVVKKDIPAYGFVPYGLNNGDTLYRDKVEEPLLSVLGDDPKALYQEGLTELGLDPNQTYEVTFLQSNASSTNRVIGEYYQDQWQKKLGVNVKIDVASDSATFNQMVHKAEYQICQTGWGADYDDPMTFLELFLTNVGDGASNNSIFFSNAEYDELIKAASVETDMDKRFEMFKRAETILVAEEAGLAPLSYSLKINYVRSDLKGVLFQAGGPEFELKNAYIEGK